MENFVGEAPMDRGEVRMPGCSGMWRWSNHDRTYD
jgi:hypothetical protein